MTVLGCRLAAICLVVFGVGCQSMPPHADSVASQPRYRANDSRDEYDGWLFRRLTGQAEPATPTQPSESRGPLAASTSSTLQGDPLAPGGIAPGAGMGHVAEDPARRDAATSHKSDPKASDDDDGGLSLESLAPSNIYKKIKATAGYGPNEEVARAAYQEGKELFEKKQYDEAAKKFALAVDRWPDTALEEDALFAQAESYFFADRYPNAHECYEKLLKKYEYSRYLDRAAAREFAIGRYWEKFDEKEPHWPLTPNFSDKMRPWFDTWGNSIKAYEHVRLNDPTGPLADDSLMAAGNAYFVRGRYEDAAYQYDTLWREYTKSEHQLKAGLLALESKQNIYQGEMYDGMALKEAGQYADQVLTRFGNTLGAERDRVVEAKNRVVELNARHELAVGRFYDKKGYYGAARIYYKSLIEDFPQTASAEQARTRLEEIKDLPAEPYNYFAWMERIFGSKKRY